MRFGQYGRNDTQDVTGGDNAWQGINSTLDKANLPPGYMSEGQNTRCRNGRVSQRRGTYRPGDFNPTTGFGNYLVGSGVFRDPNGNELLVVAPAGTTYTWNMRYGRDPFRTDYSAAAASAGDNGLGGGQNGVQFVQGFDKLIMLRRPLRGSLGPPNTYNLVWDGGAATDWEIMALSSTGRTLIPGVYTGEPFMDRIIYYNANAPAIINRDRWIMSDIEDYTSYDLVYQEFRTNTAEADFITRIMAYYHGSVIIFKSQSIHMAELLPTYPVSINQRILNKSIGSVGTKMPVMIGGDILFASAPNGFYSLSEIIQEQVTTLPVPISEPIQKTIDQINWVTTLLMGCSVAVDNYAFFGVALGKNATRLNAILVYDTQRKEWESAGDTWSDPTFAFNALHLVTYDSAQRVFAIDYATSAIYLLYEGLVDELVTGTFNVPFRMETRGYIGDDPLAFKRFGRGIISVSTYEPNVVVTAITDGVNEEKEVARITKDRNKFYQHGHAPFDISTDDPEEQKRMDYSITGSDNFVADDYEDLPAGPIEFIPATSPPVLGQFQQSLERMLVRSFGRYLSFRVENTEGAIEVTGIGVESTPAMNSTRTAA